VVENNREEPTALLLVPNLPKAVLQCAYPNGGALEQVTLASHLRLFFESYKKTAFFELIRIIQECFLN
jgi:hypothetical protein